MDCAYTDADGKQTCTRPPYYQMGTGQFTCPLHMGWKPAPPPAAPVAPAPTAPRGALPSRVAPAAPPVQTAGAPAIHGTQRAAALEVLHQTVTQFLAGRCGVLGLAKVNAALVPGPDAAVDAAEAAALEAARAVDALALDPAK